MLIVVIDGQGGGIGSRIIELLREKIEKNTHTIAAVGTNTMATGAMLKAGADCGATGENSVCVMSRKADIIAGPMGILLADSMMGEVSEKMASAVARSDAMKVVVPVRRCHVRVAGVQAMGMQDACADAAAQILSLLDDKADCIQ